MKKSKISLFGPAPSPFTFRPKAAPLDTQACLRLLQQGRGQEAEQALATLLKQEPANLQALQLLGMARIQRKDWAGSVDCLQRAVTISDQTPSIRNNLGLALRELGQNDAAIACFDRALALQPDYVAARINKGNSLRRTGHMVEGLQEFQMVTKTQPQELRALHGAALCLVDLDRADEATPLLQQALRTDPDFIEASLTLAEIRERQGAHGEALECYQQVLQRQPHNANALNGLGLVLSAQHRIQDAIGAFERAIATAPGLPQAYANLASELADLDQFDRAFQLYSKAEQLGADRAGILQQVGDLYTRSRRFSDAARSFSELHSLWPELPYACANLYVSRMKAWQWSAAATLLPSLINGLNDGTQRMLPFDSVVLFDDPALHQKLAQRDVAASHVAEVRPQNAPTSETHNRRIRLAYVSADFHNHATMHLLKETLEHHNRDQFELIAVTLGRRLQATHRQWLSRTFDRVIEGDAMGDDALISHLRGIHLDIAVDLKGHTYEARPGLFQARIAPIQVNYLGYPGTFGSTQMDYILGDRVVTPITDSAMFSEKIWHLKGCYQANGALQAQESGAAGPDRAQEGLPDGAFVFACFNNNNKITSTMVRVWLDLLSRVPSSVLWLLENDALAHQQLRQSAVAQGVAPERIVFAPRRDRRGHLARHALADLFLDTVPYGAHTTASDALREGCVMVTCKGRSFASRVGASLLTAIDCQDLITDSLTDYASLAVRLAQDETQLKSLRLRVADGIARSDLFRPDLFARKLETAYLGMLNRLQR